ncbi:MAG: sigma-54 dependent transcriptional regulator [Gemmatimonadota bacterium]|nr:sigma-54 dependent transcriptional regulator [Gemmatimonadota bacterium]MDH3368612.1 sigma-54 dependent transcriptional regulator [Gemmatimonadota bacterium]MDH3570006.1 sigma-54 dependent transcriptional regulator [Gemmatimonadota bacterium]MDH5548690.1 sigma-54 dependent transcriptional regulator [Gemmatimonadota bacterium]
MFSPTLAIVQVSDAFSELWSELAMGFGVDARIYAAADACPSGGGDVIASIVAAGGAEWQAVEWLENHWVASEQPLFVVGADPGRRIAIQLVSHGATDYFAMPDDLEMLRNAVALAVERFDENARSAAGEPAGAKAQAFREIVGESPALRDVLGRAEHILAYADATALIMGETGTGKELLARAIHTGGPRRAAPFVAVNCSALPERLIESELFGHERGAFTSAHAMKPGLFEVAEGGTLFLDEVGTVPHDLQAKLLRVLDDKEVRRVGGTKSRRVDVRLMAATNEALEVSLSEGRLRQDLYFRLSVITLTMPPLRERGDDVLLIAQALLRRLAKHHGLPSPPLHDTARRALLEHHWPGNVRELKNAIERALLLSAPGELNLGELVHPPRDSGSTRAGPIPFPAQLGKISEAAALATLTLCAGNRSETARVLGISRQRLRRLLRDN